MRRDNDSVVFHLVQVQVQCLRGGRFPQGKFYYGSFNVSCDLDMNTFKLPIVFSRFLRRSGFHNDRLTLDGIMIIPLWDLGGNGQLVFYVCL